MGWTHAEHCKVDCPILTREFSDGQGTINVSLLECQWDQLDECLDKEVEKLLAQEDGNNDEDEDQTYAPRPLAVQPNKENIDDLFEEHAVFLYEEVFNPVLEEEEVTQFLELVKFKIEDELKRCSPDGEDVDMKPFVEPDLNKEQELQDAEFAAWLMTNQDGLSREAQEKWRLDGNPEIDSVLFKHCPYPVLFRDDPLVQSLRMSRSEAEKIILGELESPNNVIPIRIRTNRAVLSPLHLALCERNEEIVDIYLKLSTQRTKVGTKCRFWLRIWISSFVCSPYNLIAENSRLWQENNSPTLNYSKVDRILFRKVKEIIEHLNQKVEEDEVRNTEVSFHIFGFNKEPRNQHAPAVETAISIACGNGDVELFKEILDLSLDSIQLYSSISILLLIESALIQLIRFGNVARFQQGSMIAQDFIGRLQRYNLLNELPNTSQGHDYTRFTIIGTSTLFNAAVETRVPQMDDVACQCFEDFKEKFGFEFAPIGMDGETSKIACIRHNTIHLLPELNFTDVNVKKMNAWLFDLMSKGNQVLSKMPMIQTTLKEHPAIYEALLSGNTHLVATTFREIRRRPYSLPVIRTLCGVLLCHIMLMRSEKAFCALKKHFKRLPLCISPWMFDEKEQAELTAFRMAPIFCMSRQIADWHVKQRKVPPRWIMELRKQLQPK